MRTSLRFPTGIRPWVFTFSCSEETDTSVLDRVEFFGDGFRAAPSCPWSQCFIFQRMTWDPRHVSAQGDSGCWDRGLGCCETNSRGPWRRRLLRGGSCHTHCPQLRFNQRMQWLPSDVRLSGRGLAAGGSLAGAFCVGLWRELPPRQGWEKPVGSGRPSMLLGWCTLSVRPHVSCHQSVNAAFPPPPLFGA